MHGKLIATALSAAAWLSCGSSFAQPVVSPADGTGAYRSGVYRNLFVEAGHTQQQVDARIESAYRQLFHGDPHTQAVVFAAGSNANGPLSLLTDWGNQDVRTEGMSYGMMIAVQLDHRQDFDALWNWARTYMYIADPAHPSHGYFSWSCQLDGTAREETAAPDGEEYFAMSLLFAARRWGNGAGIYNYQAEAERLLRAMRHRQVSSGPTRFGPRTVGPEVSEAHAMILFVPAVMNDPFTDPSYQLPAFYELWARWGPVEDRAFWARAAEASRSFFSRTTDPRTGLGPDYANFDGTPRVTAFAQSGIFGYDAWRTVSNWSVDWSWWHKAPEEPVLSDRVQAFFAAQGIGRYGPLYTLEGKPAGPAAAASPAGLVATNAVAGLAATDTRRARQFTEALWNAPVPSGQGRYYDGMLYLMSLMHAGGRFRVIPPR